MAETEGDEIEDSAAKFSIEASWQQQESTKALSQLENVVCKDWRRKNRSFSMSFKKEAISFAEVTTNRGAARKFNVDEKRIREWRQNKDLIIATCEREKEKQRLKGGGRKVAHEALEKELIIWYHQQNVQNILVTRRNMMHKARLLYDEMTDDEKRGEKFVASNGWLHKFQKRYGLNFNVKTEKR